MASRKLKKWVFIALALIAVVVLAAGVGFRMAAGMLKGQVVAALGPGSEIKELKLRWSVVEIVGLRIQGGKGWPAGDALQADRVVIRPSLNSLFSGQLQIRSIEVVKPYLSLLRSRDGKLRLLPSLIEQPSQDKQSADEPPSRSVAISRIQLEDGVVELFDATVARPPLKIRLENIRASVRDIVAPTLNSKIQFSLEGLVKGLRRDGRAQVAGWAKVVGKESSVEIELRSVDMVLLQPYLIKAGETRINNGVLDLDLRSEAKNDRLRAPGNVVISALEFSPSQSPLDTVMGMPRVAVVNFLKNNDGKIDVDFTIEGDTDNPRFSLNETFATRVASSMAEKMGVSIRGVAEGVEGLGRKGLEEAGRAAETIGTTLKGLFGGEK